MFGVGTWSKGEEKQSTVPSGALRRGVCVWVPESRRGDSGRPDQHRRVPRGLVLRASSILRGCNKGPAARGQ